MHRALLPSALALTVLTAGLTFAGAQQTQTDPAAPPDNSTPMHQHRHAPNPQREAARLGRRLNLTPDQTTKIEPILADRAAKMQALHENQQLAPEDRHQQMRAIHQNTEQQLSAILTPDQLTQLKAMRRDHRQHEMGTQPADNGQSPS